MHPQSRPDRRNLHRQTAQHDGSTERRRDGTWHGSPFRTEHPADRIAMAEGIRLGGRSGTATAEHEEVYPAHAGLAQTGEEVVWRCCGGDLHHGRSPGTPHLDAGQRLVDQRRRCPTEDHSRGQERKCDQAVAHPYEG